VLLQVLLLCYFVISAVDEHNAAGSYITAGLHKKDVMMGDS
jgi:hypothetical protein